MKLTKEEGRDIVYGDHPDWVTEETEIIEQTRWSVLRTGVFTHVPTGTSYELTWSVGATEQQDEQAFEYDDPDPHEVIKKEKVVEVWERVE